MKKIYKILDVQTNEIHEFFYLPKSLLTYPIDLARFILINEESESLEMLSMSNTEILKSKIKDFKI